MGARRLALAVCSVAACAPAAGPQVACPVAPPASMEDRVAHDFETAVLAGKDAYVSLFDFKTIGEVEILLHRYDLDGRTSERLDKRRAEFEAEDGTPYPETRERRNVGNFYPLFVKRTVGTGGCVAGPPRTRYARLLGTYFDPLPAGTPPGYETLRAHANEWWRHGGVVGIHCTGGTGNLAVVYTQRPNARGYDLITIYDD
nr:hypothetical protein [Kofleriaceae bacterium]